MITPLVLSRKAFIKTFSVFVAHSTLAGRAWSQTVASQVHAFAVPTGVIRIRLSDFPALQAESGSVRIALNPVNGNQGPDGTFYPFIINRGPNNAFYALNSRCAHQGCIVEALDPSSNRMNCFCHNSVYAIDGKRVSGPTPGNLSKYTATYDGQDVLEVKVTNLAYSLSAASVQPVQPGANRLELAFRAYRNVDYEVQYRKSLDAAPVAVQFGLTATGDIDQDVYTSPSNQTLKFYIENTAASGFYTVAMRLGQI